MSRTITRYGPEDIDKNDPVHTFIMTVVLVAVMKFMAKTKTDVEDPSAMMDAIIADILNMASDQGISITKAEIPAAFLRVQTPAT